MKSLEHHNLVDNMLTACLFNLSPHGKSPFLHHPAFSTLHSSPSPHHPPFLKSFTSFIPLIPSPLLLHHILTPLHPSSSWMMDEKSSAASSSAASSRSRVKAFSRVLTLILLLLVPPPLPWPWLWYLVRHSDATLSTMDCRGCLDLRSSNEAKIKGASFL